MKRLAWLGNPFFASSLGSLLEPLGWQVRFDPYYRPRVLTWEGVVEICGFEPDVLVFGDNSSPPGLLGLESYPCLTVFVCVDSHIHTWYPLYAQAFDLCLVSLRDHIPLFAGPRLTPTRLLWSMPFAVAEDQPLHLPKTKDIIFVGKNDPILTPARHALLARLRECFEGFESLSGSYRALFSGSRLVFNVAERGDMNFRLFEALGCGSCLVTPFIGHGFTDIFKVGSDLFAYDPEDFKGLCVLIRRLLEDEPLRIKSAAAGLSKVDTGHRAWHRARVFVDWLLAQPVRELRAERAAQANTIHASVLKPIYLHWSQALLDTPYADLYLNAAKAKP